MAKALRTADISHLPELAELAERVQQSGEPCMLIRDGRELAVLSPPPGKAARATRRRRTANPNVWLEGLIGIGASEGPTDVSTNKKRYIADAVYAESHPPAGEK